MKLAKLSFPVLLLAASLSLFSCSKDDDNHPGGDRLNAMFDQFRSEPQSFTVEAGTDDTITGSKGTKVIFYPGSFRDNSGNTISSGTVQIELIEIYKPGEMIANRVNTVTTAGNLLTSGGQIHIKATRNGEELKADTYGIAFRQNEASEKPMSLFRGGPANLYTPAATDNTIIWENDTIMSVKGTSSITNEYFFLFKESTDFGWINCDDFVDDPRPKTNITVNLPESFNNKNTQVFIVIPELNAVTSPRNYHAATNSFNMGTAVNYHLPVGLGIKIVTLATINENEYYLEITDDMTISENLTVTANPLSQSKAAVIAALEAL